MQARSIVLALSTVLSFADANITVSPTDTNIQYIGRFAPWPWGQSAVEEFSFDMPGSEIRVRVAGVTSIQCALRVYQSTGFQPNGFVALVDGRVVTSPSPASYNFTFVTAASDANFTIVYFDIASGLSPTVAHDVRIYKATEAQLNDIVVSPNFINFAGSHFA